VTGGDTEFSGRVLEPLAATTQLLGQMGQKGSFVRLEDAGHEIFVSHLDAVLEAIDAVWPAA
jgi:hypothetical protein